MQLPPEAGSQFEKSVLFYNVGTIIPLKMWAELRSFLIIWRLPKGEQYVYYLSFFLKFPNHNTWYGLCFEMMLGWSKLLEI